MHRVELAPYEQIFAEGLDPRFHCFKNDPRHRSTHPNPHRTSAPRAARREREAAARCRVEDLQRTLKNAVPHPTTAKTHAHFRDPLTAQRGRVMRGMGAEAQLP